MVKASEERTKTVVKEAVKTLIEESESRIGAKNKNELTELETRIKESEEKTRNELKG